jgi:hypothetical protein
MLLTRGFRDQWIICSGPLVSQHLLLFCHSHKIRPGQKLKNKTKLLIPNLKLMYIIKILKFQLPELTYDGPLITDIATSQLHSSLRASKPYFLYGSP